MAKQRIVEQDYGKTTTCDCGCGKRIMRLDNKCRPRKFIPSHQFKTMDVSEFSRGNIPWNKGKVGLGVI